MNWGSVATQIAEDELNKTVVNTEPIRSGVNQSFKVELSNGSLFIKFGTEAGDRIKTEAFVYQKLNGIIPIPDLVLHSSVNGTPYIVTEWIEDGAVQYTLTNESSKEISHRMGSILRNIHDETVEIGVIGIEGHSHQDWSDFYKQWLIHNGEDVKKNYPNLGSEIMECVYNCSVPELAKSVISPMDFHAGNCICKNGNILAVIDFERSYGGDPRWSYEVSKRIIGINGDEEAFQNGYDDSELVNDPIFDLAGLCRELRMSHMIFDSLDDRRSTYQEELDSIKNRIFS